MKKFLVLVMAVLFVVSCNKVCDLAKQGTTQLSKALATRWECDQTKLYDFMIKPVNSYVCKDATKGVWDESVCPLVIGEVVKLGAAEIVSRFTCNSVKVTADLNNSTKLCEALGNILPKPE